jgi:hypothetical protein
MYLLDIRGEAEILGDIRVILWGVIAEGDETDTQVLGVLQFSRGEDGSADLLDVLRRG